MANSNRRQSLRFQRQLERAKIIPLKIPTRLTKKGIEVQDLRDALNNEPARAKKFVIFGGKY